MLAIAAVVTLIMTTVMSMTGVGSGRVIVPALVAAGLQSERASASPSFVVIFARWPAFSLPTSSTALLHWCCWRLP